MVFIAAPAAKTVIRVGAGVFASCMDCSDRWKRYDVLGSDADATQVTDAELAAAIAAPAVHGTVASQRARMLSRNGRSGNCGDIRQSRDGHGREAAGSTAIADDTLVVRVATPATYGTIFEESAV